ncbi:MAG: hypothetical protein KGM24_10240 [Elusimicrobia bacterium]|nr:hypothetical protein [Elusimicrobiota bacterium]
MRGGAVLGALLLCAAAVRAQAGSSFDPTGAWLSRDGRSEATLLTGDFHPTARFGINGTAGDKGERFGRDGYYFGVDYFHRLAPLTYSDRGFDRTLAVLDAGVEADYVSRSAYALKGLAAYPGASARVRGDSQVVLALLRVSGPWKGVRPYLIVGVGAHRTRMDAYLQASSGYSWAGSELPLVRAEATGLAMAGRCGVEKVFADGGVLGLEFGYLTMASRTYPATSSLGAPDVVSRGDGYTLAAKFGVRFGGGS